MGLFVSAQIWPEILVHSKLLVQFTYCIPNDQGLFVKPFFNSKGYSPGFPSISIAICVGIGTISYQNLQMLGHKGDRV